MTWTTRSAPLIALALAACSTPAAAPTDAAMRDGGLLPDAGRAPDAARPPDAGGCARAAASTWTSEGVTDVDVEFRAALRPMVGGRSELSILFERYAPEPPIGTFVLGPEGPDANFGDCARCVFVGVDPTRAFFADRGALVVRADPYRGRLDASVSGLRLVEVAVDPFTRASTPIEGGACIEVDDFTVEAVFPPTGWTCDASRFDDGSACDCACGAFDLDCGEEFCAPDDPTCEPRPPLPIADCVAGEICAFDPEIATTRCTEACDWRTRAGCSVGTCTPSLGFDAADLCLLGDERIDGARIGGACLRTGYQRFCDVVDGIALGYCDHDDTCRPVCASDAECTIAGETCRRFFGEDGLGYCGPPPPLEG